MRGDFTRGHRPDQKRGRNYRRVLLQQGRLLLDSDFNALVDAHDELLRDLSRDTACLAGSPDLGYLVTAGRLLALFDSLEGIDAGGAGLDMYRDYSHKYLDRYPSLYLGNATGAAVTVELPLRAETLGEIDLWLRSDGVSNINVSGSPINVTSGTFEPHTVNPPSTQVLEITLDDGQEVWLGLVERHQEAGTLPTFWAAEGRFHIDGLMVEIPEDGPYSDLHFDPAEGFQIPDLEVDDGGLRPLEPGDRVLAYLEAFERHITHVEDRGILEEALGGGDDTCTRSQALCQVKVAAAGGLAPEELRRIVRSPLLPDGTLEVTTAPAAADPDPCALPIAGGYRGTDNRLYRFEVHRGGPLTDVLFKWSRDNGSELFRARDVTVAGPTITQLIFPAESPLESGDLVEVLDEPHERGDQAFARVDDGAPNFTAPERAVGRLVRLQAAAGPVDGKAFDMSEPDDDSIPVVLTDFGAPPDPMPKVRRWHGLIEPGGAADPFQVEVEDGLEIEVTGSFRAGDWWQYEARARRGNDNGPFQITPHGPERLFAPLGLFEYQGDTEPLELIAWLDERFPRLCGICADDVCFDGERVGAEECDTVQEALEKLFERESGGCCEHTLSTEEAGDDAARIRQLLDESLGDVTVCLRSGIYRLESIVEISERCLTLKGCPEAVLVASVDGGVAPFRVAGGGRLRFENLILFAPHEEEAPVQELINLGVGAESFETHEAALVMAGPVDRQIAIRQGDADPLIFDPMNPALSLANAPRLPGLELPTISLQDSVVIAGWAIVGSAIQDLEVRSSALYLTTGGLSISNIVGAHLSDNSWIIGVSADFTAGWTAAELALEPKRLLDNLAEEVGPLRGAISDPGGVVGWLTQNLLFGTMERNVVVASIGAVVGEAQGCQWSDNFIQGASHGIDVEEARVSSWTRELVLVERDGIVGIQAYSASGLTVSDCQVFSGAIGIRLGGTEQVEFDGSDLAYYDGYYRGFRNNVVFSRLEQVQLNGNRVTAQIGIQLGAAGVNGFFGQVEEISMRRNQVESRIGMLLRGPLGAFIAPNQVIADGNDLRCLEAGVDIAGAGIAVTANSIAMDGVNAQTAVRMFQAPRALIQDNTVSGQLGFDGGYGIWCQGSPWCRIQDNHLDLVEGASALLMTDCDEGRVIDNDFGFTGFVVNSCDRATVQGNRASFAHLNDCTGGTVKDNTVASDLRALSALGRWQIEDNRAGGRIDLIPDGVVAPGAGGGVVASDDYTTAVAGNWVAAAVEFLGADVVAEETGEEEVPVTTGRRLLGSVRGTEARAAVSYAAENPDWRIAWADTLVAETDGYLIRELFELEDLVIVINTFFEAEYHAQLVGNWAHTMQVGHASGLGGVVSDRQTIVQVVGNRADSLLDVRRYVHAIASGNAAGLLTDWIDHQVQVGMPNIEF